MAIGLAVCSALAGSPAAAQERGPAGTVTLPRPDYDRLLDLAGRHPRPPEGAPLPAALTRADIRARIAGGAVRATMAIEGEVFQSGSVKVPLVTNATLLDARSADRPLPLIAEGNAHVALVTGPGAFAATLEWGSAVATAPGRGSFVLPVPPAGSATATFDVPGEQSDLRISPGLILSRTSANGRTLVEAALDPGSATQVSWTSRETGPAVAARDVRLLSDVKSLVTIDAAEVRLLSLVDVTVVQGEPAQFEVAIPAGYELASVTGGTLDRSDQQNGRIILAVSGAARRRHQFLLDLERSNAGGSFRLETGFPTVTGSQRETGEVAVAGLGTLEVSGAEVPGLRRMDVREADPSLTAAARSSLLAAYRYQRSAAGVPTLALDVVRFPDASVLAAIAERAVATTLVTSQGRALTEVSLWLRNRAQPFMRVALPGGASMLSVEVAGAPAKPAEGADGMRVPLLRAGFRPDGPYIVSFVYIHAGPPFGKKGNMQMTLPRMDVPVSLVEWELFVPAEYRANRFAGSAIAAHLVEETRFIETEHAAVRLPAALPAAPGQIVGRVVDTTGSPIPGATIVAEVNRQRLTTVSQADGRYAFSGVPSGPVAVSSQLEGFKTVRRSVLFDQRPRQLDFELAPGGLSETVTVTAEAPVIDTRSSAVSQTMTADQLSKGAQAHASGRGADQAAQEPSMNVQNLQRRAAGVLPIEIDVPRTGASHRFVRPLVVDEETIVRFDYKRR